MGTVGCGMPRSLLERGKGLALASMAPRWRVDAAAMVQTQARASRCPPVKGSATGCSSAPEKGRVSMQRIRRRSARKEIVHVWTQAAAEALQLMQLEQQSKRMPKRKTMEKHDLEVQLALMAARSPRLPPCVGRGGWRARRIPVWR
jgi:hypothetical protein